ncbi:response regulator [Pseudoalteromonas tunicata]|uniref:response regulator n=1 Tax=Pseudoalteromonas tunicata TaxID=314281 RepID=UPI00273FE65E|nr:response regulator [Pseudoalteromonas tunicata]MDP4985553.1 response regulator [Pseudoalteromonas tunicata]
MNHILLVDDEPEVLNALTRILRKDYTLTTANSAAQALEILSTIKCDLIISDIRMPQMDGIELLAQIKRDYPSVGRVLLSGYADMDQCQMAISDNIAKIILAKPWDNFELKNIINLMIEYNQLKQANQTLQLKLDQFRSMS